MSNQKVEIMLAQKRYDMAYDELKAILALNPDDIHAQSMLAICCINLRKLEEGEAVILNALYLQPWNAYFKFLLANLFAIDNKIDKGIVAINEAIELDSYNDDYFDLKSRLHLSKNEFEQAEEAARASLEIDPENEDALNSLSKALIGQNKKLEAADVMHKALEKNPENWETHANYGYRSLELGKVKEAIEHFRNALINDPSQEFAQQGMKLAMKAKFPLYKWLLQFQLYMTKKGRSFNLAFIIGLVFLVNILQRIQDNVSGFIRYGIISIIGLLMLFVFSSWILDPIMNLVLYSNKNGRLSLSEEESNTAKFVGINLIIAALGILFYFVFQDISTINLSLMGLLGLLCASGMWEREPASSRKLPRAFYIIGSILFLTGLTSKIWGDSNLSDLFSSAGILTGVLYTWVGNSSFRRDY